MSKLYSNTAQVQNYFSFGLGLSLFLHIFAVIISLLSASFFPSKDFKPVVYSITIEGGQKLGGMSQVPDKSKSSQIAPPKKIQEQSATQPKEKIDPDTLIIKEEKKVEKKIETKPDPKKDLKPKKDEKKPDEKNKNIKDKKPTKTETPEDIDKKLQQAMQRYLGESSDAGAKGFGAAKLGGRGMGGGELRPAEFFVYKRVLESYLKSGWRWPDSFANLQTVVEIDLEADGNIADIRIAKSSGIGEFDDSVIRAIKKANPVPKPPDKVYDFFKQVRVTFDPRD